MSPTEQTAIKLSAATGFFAMLGGLLRIQGRSAPKISLMNGSGASKISLWLVLSVLATALGGLAFTAAPALAAAPETPELTVEAVTATEARLHGVLSPKARRPVGDGRYEFLYKASETEGEGGTKR
jgi:hypothetical protein